jgi:hypothetical protein
VTRSAQIASLALFLAAGVLADPASPRQEARLVKDYRGAHEDAFNAEYDRVRLLVHQAQLEVSSRLGLLQYRQGFQYPLTVRFEDSAPVGLESTLAYVRLTSSSQGFAQELVVNLDELTRHPMDFDTVFYHEMTHAVLNDAIGAEATQKIPHWVQEGLAIYVSGEGEARVKKAAASVAWRDLPQLLWPLQSPYAAAAYPQYYLDVKYILDKGTINALQGFVRDLIAGESPAEAVRDTLGQEFAAFQQGVRDYSLKAFQQACDRGPYHVEACR